MVSDDLDPTDEATIVARIRTQAAAKAVQISRHAQDALFEDGFMEDDLFQALAECVILENYPDHRRGSCCLIYGTTPKRRPMHIVCSTGTPILTIITVYEPTLPKWVTPTRRRR